MKKIAQYFQGIVFVEIVGAFPERFINICRSRHIPLYDIATTRQKDKEIYTAKIAGKDYFKIKPVAKKSHCLPKIRKKIGFPFFVKRYKNRLAFLAGGMYCLWFMWILSLFVWDISVTGGFVHTEDEIISYLRENRIVCGMRKDNVDCTELERNIRLDYPDIGWVSVELKGTKLFIRIAETDMPMAKEGEEAPVHLVAATDGKIEQLVCRSGTPMVQVGDVVKKGDILVRGIIDVIGDNDSKLKSYPVRADADIMIQSVRKYSHSLERCYVEKYYTKNTKTGYEFFYGNKKIFSHMPSHSYTNYAIITEDAVLSLHEHFPLPFRVQKRTVSEYVPEVRDYTKEEAECVAKQALDRYLAYLANNNTTVLSAKTETVVGADTVKTEGKLLLLAEAWEQVAVQEDEWRLGNADEYSRDNDEPTGGA